MVQVHIIAEGRTEVNFVKGLLKAWFARRNIFLTASQVTTRKDRKLGRVHRGGLVNLEHLLNDIRKFARQFERQSDRYLTTLVDLYSFPLHERPDWRQEVESRSSGR
ncbi:MAG: DUF4276 family protein [Bacteroidetes bacterium]|nr:MAG: DUF4276 family protein [Bacteroidota bacterium]